MSANIQPTFKYIAYGDDSQFDNILVYAFVVIEKDKLEILESSISKLKLFYNIPDNAILHCREMFNGDARKKGNLKHLSSENIQKIICRVVRIINNTPILIRYAYCDRNKIENIAQSKNIQLSNSEQTNFQDMWFNPTDKGVLGALAQACFGVAQDGSQGPLVTECQVIVSEDKTKVEFIGNNKKQAHNWCSGFIQINNNAVKITPIVKRQAEEVGLQIADIVAYMCSHALSDNNKAIFFKKQLQKILYWTRGNLLLDIQ